MVGERRNGNLLVQLGPKMQAYPEELIRQRRAQDGHMEYLIRWNVLAVEETGTGSSGSASSSADSKAENILMWMSAEDVYANCPTLLGKRKPEAQRVPEEQATPSGFSADVTLDEMELTEMKMDVRNLVQRARKQMAQGPMTAVHILHTIHVLSAYASIGSLVGVFKETGALDLLMEMLCNEEKQVRRSAGKMLRALASHDAGSRAYVLLSLSQQDGIEQHMDFDNRYTLLELFAETTSSEEHCISFEGIHLPQIPGKLLFSLVKRYLCVTSLVDKLNNSGTEAEQRQDCTSSSWEHCRALREFDFTMAMANLISELVRVMGWDRNQRNGAHMALQMCQEEEQQQPKIIRSIFQPRAPPCASVLAPPPRKKAANGFKTRADFASRSSYVEYMQENLKAGMAVRMLEDYEQVSAGDEGEFRHSNDGTPPVQVYWNSLSRTYWVHWHMVEIIGSGSSGQAEKEAQEKASSLAENIKLNTVTQTFFYKPPGGMYSLPYLTESLNEDSGTLSRAEWWEILFFVKKLEPKQQQEINNIIRQSLDDQVLEMNELTLIEISVPVELAQDLLQYLLEHSPPSSLGDLRSSRVYIRRYLQSRRAGLEHAHILNGCGSAGFSPGSLSKKPKKELCASDAVPDSSQLKEKDSQGSRTVSRLDELQLPPDMAERMKVFNCSKVSGKQHLLDRFGEVLEMMKKSASDVGLQAAGLKFITRALEEAGPQKIVLQADSTFTIRDKLVKLLVELLTNQMKEKTVVVLALGLVQVLMSKYDWRVLFVTEGGIKATLSCMQEHADSALVQQSGLTTLKILTGASKHDLDGAGTRTPLSDSDAQIVREICASIGTASSDSAKGLLGAIPAAIEKMLETVGCSSAVQDGILVVIMLVYNHKVLAEQLLACDIQRVLRKCLANEGGSPPSPCHMLAIIALSHISDHKINTSRARSDTLELKDVTEMELEMLLVSLKETNVTKEIVLAIERRLCDETASMQMEMSDVMKDPAIFQALLRSLDQHRGEKVVQQGVLRILNKFLDNYQEDILPWHESIESCLSSMTAFINDREVVQEFVRFLYRLATTNKDYAVVMCRLGTKEALTTALDKHSNLLQVTELRDLVNDCEKNASLYKKMTTSVLAGCIQMVLGQIEEHRRSHQPINIPFFDVFLRNLCQGSSVEIKEDKCWEKVEVSSNHHRASKLTDKNPKTYWESNGSTGSHFINIYIHNGVIIRQLTLLVASEDSSYMPARIVVMGGDSPSNINTELNTVNVPPSGSRVVLLENMTRFWAIIQIKIKRCQQGGIDTRVHGFELLGPKPTFWPVFKEQLCRRTYLFYTTKVHTWCQEILEDRLQLLQLFNKLNSALRHEQMFADRFLPDAEAAEALGRTCWEALINPIVQSVTATDTASPSPMSWLLTEYLENSEISRRSKSRAAIFNSRVRRLTHLLVHVDTSRVETEELKPPTKPEGNKRKEPVSTAAKAKEKTTSSVTGITQCWQEVVQQQVKKFLESSWNSPSFVEYYRNLYLRLKKAMEELFGQQTAFMLALRQGFSAALLQLSFLTAMHVSEQFARYIDQRIQESGMDTSNVGRLNQLQQFLEPILFLSGLELANTFEHFYRFYLGDRLLTQGNAWLESAVIEQVGTCFPNRFPQQMVKNLSESKELQEEFHLYRLQQLDKKLQDMDEEMMEDQPSFPEEESELKVLVLSPRCWTVSPLCYLDKPVKYFPASFSTYLDEFAEFYSNSQSLYCLDHSRPRRLQWTWLGRAELQYNSLTLYVSTLQMYILLQFNQQEEVSLESLLQATDLSHILLNHALKPLTVEKGILIRTGSDTDAPSGVLRLNRAALSQAGETRHYCTLLPKQTYLNVEEDAANSLEKKRNVIRCLIIQIMKAERELHIDNLVFRVINACQKCETKEHPKLLGFSCCNTDVLSCIMHLINQNYIRRSEDSPHILQYISTDPSTPRKGQAHIIFKAPSAQKPVSTTEKDNIPTFSFDGISGSAQNVEQSVLETVLFPMGRTMNQEEVHQLMSQTVAQVQDTLSISSDVAQHLLVHCKWNVDVLIQRYMEDSELLMLSAGLQVRNPQPHTNSVTQCPVCVSQLSSTKDLPTLCCMHYCCKMCWKEYLTTRIELNLVLNCTCPISDCPAQPTTQFIQSIITDKEVLAKYENALLRGYVECCSNLTWCTNPQGCDQILCKEGIGNGEACSKCSWLSCFSCNFPEAHYPASCSHMSQWMDDGGYYEGMTKEAQSKHLAKLISKRCPSCQAQIEKNEGCLHMTCAKCNHGFCWRCLKPWKPTHKDYYNCTAMVSKAARQEKRFHDYNERCTFQHQAREFAIFLKTRVSGISEAPDMKTLTFVIDACKVLEQARKVLAYSCVYSYYNQDTEKMDIMEQQTENLELHTNALQILLEETLLQCQDLASSIRLLKTEHLNTGLELIRRIQERLAAILQHSTQGEVRRSLHYS
ncbi:cullin-9 isoform X2 [Latimeria chalumnae]|uniref:cullin-9 isoform X2 n=1 Tax=Latimeria chalumnae TaxID=7897 RepID=UPI00313AC5EF